MAESISKLIKLRKLVVLDCGLDLVPECFRNLKKLEELSLPGNNIVTLPNWLNDLPVLRKISLGRKLTDTEKINYSVSHPKIEII
jgi:Leucine-rich repeat (LRR) protein